MNKGVWIGQFDPVPEIVEGGKYVILDIHEDGWQFHFLRVDNGVLYSAPVVYVEDVVYISENLRLCEEVPDWDTGLLRDSWSIEPEQHLNQRIAVYDETKHYISKQVRQ